MKIWVGKRESDIQTYDYFDYSITFWGSNENGNYAFCSKKRIHSSYSNEFTSFTIIKLKELIKTTSEECFIYFYNNSFAYKILNIESSFSKNIKNINKSYVHNLLRHKTLSRIWLSNIVNVPPITLISKYECNIQNLKKFFKSFDAFVLQENYSSGGDGTYYVDENNINTVMSILSDSKLYLVSPYYDNNVSVSCTLLIDNNTCCILPVSKQILKLDSH